MKAVVCELCGSNDIVKQDGYFVCQHCGTKYTLEEAKKLLGVVKIDNSDSIGNYMTMAVSAREAGNNEEAETYCNKIIEIDPTHSDAWLLKGIASAWQSTLANIRMDEFITDATNAFNYAGSVDILNSLADRAYCEYYDIALAINNLKLNNILKYPKNYEKYIQFPVTCLSWGFEIQIAYGTAFNKFFENKPEEEKQKPRSLLSELGLDDLNEKIISKLVSSGITLWNNSLNTYNSSNDGFPSDYALQTMMENGTIAMCMLDYVVPNDTSKITENEKPIIINACKNLIVMKQRWMDFKSYSVSFSNGVKTYPVSKVVNVSSKQKIISEIQKYHNVIKACDPNYMVPTAAKPKDAFTKDPEFIKQYKRKGGPIVFLIFSAVLAGISFLTFFGYFLASANSGVSVIGLILTPIITIGLIVMLVFSIINLKKVNKHNADLIKSYREKTKQEEKTE